MRRLLLKSLLAASVTPLLPAVASPAVPAELTDPFRPVKIRVPADAHIIREFMAFNCSFCRNYHDLLHRWGTTLPPQYRFVTTPVVTDTNGSIMASMLYYAVFIADYPKLQDYIRHLFQLIQTENRPMGDKRTYQEAIRRAKIDLPRLKAAMARPDPATHTTSAARLLMQFGVTNTPSLVIGGTYIINPEVVNGDENEFITLANAIVSKYIQEN